MADNIFNQILDKPMTALTADSLTSPWGVEKGKTLLVYPDGLASARSSRGRTQFVVFAPYNRNAPGSASITATAQTKIFDQIPTPHFAIVLPLPTSALKTSYGVQYDPVELGEWGLASDAAKEKWKSFTGIGNNIKDFFGLGASPPASGGGGTVGGLGSYTGLNMLLGAVSVLPKGETLAAIIQKSTDTVPNPFTELLFKNVQFRTHEFQYTFLPKSPQDSQKVDDIIRALKFYMMPAYQTSTKVSVPTNGNVSVSRFEMPFFSFPYEFQIVYSAQDTTFALLPSVLETLDVDYGGGLDSPKFFVPNEKDRKQYPTKITMNLKFKEIMILTRNIMSAETDSAFPWDNTDVSHIPGSSEPKPRRYRF